MSQRLVTVLMPVFNAEKHIKEAIDSILNQTYSDFEFLIIDDGSTDRSAEIISSYDDPRINFKKNERNLKVTATLNLGLQSIHTKYIVRMDADDISLPHRIATQLDLMESREDIVLCGSGRITFVEGREGSEEEVKTITDEKQLLIHSLFNTSISHPSVMMRTSVLKDHNIVYNSHYIYAQDKAMWLELAKFGTIYNIEEPLIKYRLHPNQVTNKHENISRENSVKISREVLKKLGVSIQDHELFALMLLCYPQSCRSVKDLFVADKIAGRILRHLRQNDQFDFKYLRQFLMKRLTRITVYSSALGLPVLLFILLSRKLTLLKFGKEFYIKTLLKRQK